MPSIFFVNFYLFVNIDIIAGKQGKVGQPKEVGLIMNDMRTQVLFVIIYNAKFKITFILCSYHSIFKDLKQTCILDQIYNVIWDREFFVSSHQRSLYKINTSHERE